MLSRLVHRLLFGAALVVSLVALLLVSGLLWLRSPLSNDFLRHRIVSALDGVVNGEVRLEGVSGDPLRGMRLEGFALVDEDGTPLVDAEALEVSYAIPPLFEKRIVLDRVRLIRPEITLHRDAERRWNWTTMFRVAKPAPGDTVPGWGSYIAIDRVEIVDGTVDVRIAEGTWPILEWNENTFRDIDGSAGLLIDTRGDDVVRVEPRDLAFRTTAPPLGVVRVDGTWTLRPERLGFDEIVFETEGSEFHLDGTVLRARDSMALAVEAPRVDLGEMRRLFPEIRVDGGGSFTGRVVGPARDPTVEIDEVAIESGGSRVEGSGRLVDVASALVLDLDLRVDPLMPERVRTFLDVYPVAQHVSGRVTLRGPPRQLDVSGDLVAPAGAFSVRGSLDLRGPVPSYDLAATSESLDIGALIGRPSIELDLTGRYTLAGSGFSGASRDARFEGELGRSSIYRWDVLSLTTAGRLTTSTYAADTLVVRTANSVARGEGTFGLSGDGVIEAAIDLDSEAPAELWPPLGESSGSVSGQVDLSGTYEGFEVAGDVEARDLSLAGFQAESFEGDVRLEDVAGEAFRMAADGAFRSFETAGIPADSVAVDLSYADRRMDVGATFDHGRGTTTAVAGTADFTGPTRFVLERFRHETPESSWSMEQAGSLTVTGERLEADSLTIRDQGQVVRLDGTFAYDGRVDLAFSVDDLRLEEVARVLQQPPGDWQGTADVEGTVRGSRGTPVMSVIGRVSEGRIKGFRFARIEGGFEYEDRLADVDVVVTAPRPGSELVFEGTAPVNLALVGGVDRLPDRPVDLRLRGRGTDLSLISTVVPGLEDLAGPIDLEVTVRGSTESPRFEGVATLTNGRMTISRTGAAFRGIEGRVAFDNDRITVQRLTGADRDDGTFEVSGTVAMENLRLGEFDLSVDASTLRVLDLNRQEVQVDGEIAIAGTTEHPVLTGRVRVAEAVYRLPSRSEKDVIDLDEAVIYVDIPGAGREPLPERSPSMWDRSRVDVEVRVRNAILLSANARIEIAGDLALVKPPGNETPSFSGTLDVRRGFYEEFGHRFTIEEGEVFFYGTPEVNPGLHIVATRSVESVAQVGSVDIQIILGGTLKNPTIDLESNPPFEKSEIISIALFGSPQVGAGQQEQFNRAVFGLLGGTAAAPLQTALSEELSLDLLEVSQREEEGDTATLVRVGKFIGPDVYLTFEQAFGGVEERSLVGLRYNITDQFTLQVTTGRRRDRPAAGIDLFWEITY